MTTADEPLQWASRPSMRTAVPEPRVITLEVAQFHIQRTLSPHFATPATLHEMYQPMFDNMTYAIIQKVAKQTHERIHVEYPASWWDHVKQHFRLHEKFPRAFRQPVMVRRTMEAATYYPNIAIPEKASRNTGVHLAILGGETP